MVEGGDSAVLAYLRDMGSGAKVRLIVASKDGVVSLFLLQDVWPSFKIMVLGKEGAGKTHIFHLASVSHFPPRLLLSIFFREALIHVMLQLMELTFTLLL